MKKHYIFISIKKDDISAFRKVLVSSLWMRAFACLAAIVILCIMGYLKKKIIVANFICAVVYVFAFGFIVALALLEVPPLIQASTLKKSSLLPFIHTPKEDASFYSEELPGGFLVQSEPVTGTDRDRGREQLRILADSCSNQLLLQHLDLWINGSDQHMINKAVIYLEIISVQLEKGNKDILATCDTLKNCREDLL